MDLIINRTRTNTGNFKQIYIAVFVHGSDMLRSDVPVFFFIFFLHLNRHHFFVIFYSKLMKVLYLSVWSLSAIQKIKCYVSRFFFLSTLWKATHDHTNNNLYLDPNDLHRKKLRESYPGPISAIGQNFCLCILHISSFPNFFPFKNPVKTHQKYDDNVTIYARITLTLKKEKYAK